jgi:hypothetical protein
VLVEPLALLEPPAAESSFFGVVGLLDMEPEVEPEAEPEGELGVVVEPADDDAPEPGVVRETARSPASRSQPASNPAPSARDTATAKVESLMCGPPWLG